MKKFQMCLGVIFGGTMLMACSTTSVSLGVKEGKLVACPKSPNCVVTYPYDEAHFVEPMVVQEPDQALLMHKVVDAIAKHSRTEIVSKTDNYVHATFKSFLGFVDDVEFYFDADSQLLHLRSASQTGRGDFGVNKRRYETLKKTLQDWGLVK